MNKKNYFENCVCKSVSVVDFMEADSEDYKVVIVQKMLFLSVGKIVYSFLKKDELIRLKIRSSSHCGFKIDIRGGASF